MSTTNRLTVYPKSQRAFDIVCGVLRLHEIEFEQRYEPFRIICSCEEVYVVPFRVVFESGSFETKDLTRKSISLSESFFDFWVNEYIMSP